LPQQAERNIHATVYCLKYLSLALAAFLAATIVPASSELILALLLAADANRFLCWIIASVANTLGSCVNWWLGRFARRYQNARWFPVSEKSLQRSERWVNRYGVSALLLAWVPIAGDAICVAAGLLRVPLRTFVPLVFIGKAARYAVFILIVGQVSASL